MTTSDDAQFGSNDGFDGSLAPPAGEDATSVFGRGYEGYAQPGAGDDVGDHYFTHGDSYDDGVAGQQYSAEQYSAEQYSGGQYGAQQNDNYGYETGACDCDDLNHDHGQDADYYEAEAAGLKGKPAKRKPVTRRRFIQGLAVAGTVGIGVMRGAKPVDRQLVESQLANRAASTGGLANVNESAQIQIAAPNVEGVLDQFTPNQGVLLNAAPVDQRVLVLIEFQGGNDGISMVVPYGSNRYYDSRPRLAIQPDQVLPIDSDVGLAPALARLHQRQLTTVEGVGPVDGVLSHFEMVERWELGDMRGLGGQRAGFLARLADAVDTGGAVTGLSVAGHTPRLDASQSSTLSLNDLNQLRVLTNDEWIFPQYRNAVRSFGGGPMSTTITDSWQKLFNVGDAINTDIDKIDRDSVMIREGAQLGRQLAMAAEMIKADVGVRVIHASLGGFDTHEGHQGRHNQLMGRFDAAVDGFLQEIDNAGMADRVLVATSSEFGRRVSENGSGLDHGAASSMLLVGPVRPGRAGDPSPLGDLDRQGNLRTTVPFDRYLATLSQDWLGVEAARILPEAPLPLGLI
ncbi:MAG: DUF1501 domain-containing protein [Acidimicrobiales bacterium]